MPPLEHFLNIYKQVFVDSPKPICMPALRFLLFFSSLLTVYVKLLLPTFRDYRYFICFFCFLFFFRFAIDIEYLTANVG
jgi:hypothetical protein